jgi:hypothetical protein
MAWVVLMDRLVRTAAAMVLVAGCSLDEFFAGKPDAASSAGGGSAGSGGHGGNAGAGACQGGSGGGSGPGGGGTATALALGAAHSCAIKTDNSPWCWGNNDNEELGIGAGMDESSPVPLVTLGDVNVVVAGALHSCAIKTDGSLWCWGKNGNSQLGAGQAGDNGPVQVGAIGKPVADVAAGQFHTCAVKMDQSLWCWGANMKGQIGNGAGNTEQAPTALRGTWALVTAGELHSCGLKTDGTLWCWGNNADGQLGLGDAGTGTEGTPVAVVTPLDMGVKAITAGGRHSCALKVDDTLWCWGANESGQLGRGTTSPSEGQPAAVIGFDGPVRAIAAGQAHTCAITLCDTLYCWGSNAAGQIGDGNATVPAKKPVAIAIGVGATAVAAGGLHTCAGTADGELRCWGANESGQLGNETMMPADLPQPVSNWP